MLISFYSSPKMMMALKSVLLPTLLTKKARSHLQMNMTVTLQRENYHLYHLNPFSLLLNNASLSMARLYSQSVRKTATSSVTMTKMMTFGNLPRKREN